jgi:hypothetical protein
MLSNPARATETQSFLKLAQASADRDAADDGASHLGTKACRHHFNHLEERGEFRRPTIKSASNLSIAGVAGFPVSGDSLSGGGRSGSGDARFEGEYQSMSSPPCASPPSHPSHTISLIEKTGVRWWVNQVAELPSTSSRPRK